MALDVSALKQQIEKEKESLKSVDENIRKITGRDPSEPRPGNDTRRISIGSVRDRDLSVASFRRRRPTDARNDEKGSEPPQKRAAVFSRLGGAPRGRRVVVASRMSKAQHKEEDEEEEEDEEDVGVKPSVQSSVVSTAKKITRDELINAQNAGGKGKARNRRMFGMLLGTLARFDADSQGRQSKQVLKQKEVETRLEEETEQERRKLASERKTLFNERRMQQRRINLLEEKIALANELVEWENEWKKKSQYIMTKASPGIFFMPVEFSPRTTRALQDSKDRIKELVDKHKKSVAETMSAYDAEIKMLETKQDNGKGVENGGGMHVSRGFKRGSRIDPEPEEEMDLDSMEPQVDIKVEMDEADQQSREAENDIPTKADNSDQPISDCHEVSVNVEFTEGSPAHDSQNHDVAMNTDIGKPQDQGEQVSPVNDREDPDYNEPKETTDSSLKDQADYGDKDHSTNADTCNNEVVESQKSESAEDGVENAVRVGEAQQMMTDEIEADEIPKNSDTENSKDPPELASTDADKEPSSAIKTVEQDEQQVKLVKPHKEQMSDGGTSGESDSSSKDQENVQEIQKQATNKPDSDKMPVKQDVDQEETIESSASESDNNLEKNTKSDRKDIVEKPSESKKETQNRKKRAEASSSSSSSSSSEDEPEKRNPKSRSSQPLSRRRDASPEKPRRQRKRTQSSKDESDDSSSSDEDDRRRDSRRRTNDRRSHRRTSRERYTSSRKRSYGRSRSPDRRNNRRERDRRRR